MPSNIDELRHEFRNGDKFRGRMIVDPSGRTEPQPLAGVYLYRNGDVFQGTFLNSEWHGNSKYTWANGDVYDGCFVYGGVAGKGHFVSKQSNTEFLGKFGRRRTKHDKQPLPSGLEDTILYRGLSSARGLMPLPLVPSEGRLAKMWRRDKM